MRNRKTYIVVIQQHLITVAEIEAASRKAACAAALAAYQKPQRTEISATEATLSVGENQYLGAEVKVRHVEAARWATPAKSA
jgi:hypothetical protein